MVPPESLFTAATQSSSDFCSGCDAGTQCETFSSKVLSCANAGVTLAASSTARQAFLITRLSLCLTAGFDGPVPLINMLSNWPARSSRKPHPPRRLDLSQPCCMDLSRCGDAHSPFAQPLYSITILRGPARQASRDANLQDRKEQVLRTKVAIIGAGPA